VFKYFINTQDSNTQYPIKKYYKWEAIKKLYNIELAKVKEYYRHREYNFSNNNMLTKLIKTLSRSTTLPVLDYLEYIDTDIPYICKQMGITNNLSQGKVHDNVLFEGNSKEVFISVNSTIDPFSMCDVWLDYPSIRAVKTDVTDLDYPVLFRYPKLGLGISVFEIDIRAIMLQYYYWSKGRMFNDLDTSVNIFIPLVVIPNILDSMIDLAIWNRYITIANGNKIYNPESSRHAINVINLTSRIDNVLKDVIKDTKDHSLYITQFLRHIPVLLEQDMYNVLNIHKEIYNRQSKWVLWVTRISDIVSIHKTLGVRGYRLNKNWFNLLPYEIKLIENRDGALDNILGEYHYSTFQNNINYIKENIGKR